MAAEFVSDNEHESMDLEYVDQQSPVLVAGNHTMGSDGQIRSVNSKVYGQVKTPANDYSVKRVQLEDNERHLVTQVNQEVDEYIARSGIPDGYTRGALVHEKLVEAVGEFRIQQQRAQQSRQQKQQQERQEQEVKASRKRAAIEPARKGPAEGAAGFSSKPERPSPRPRPRKVQSEGASGLGSLKIAGLDEEPFSPNYAELSLLDTNQRPIRFRYHWGIDDSPEKLVLIYDVRYKEFPWKVISRLRSQEGGSLVLRVGETREEVEESPGFNVLGVVQAYQFGVFVHLVFILAD